MEKLQFVVLAGEVLVEGCAELLEGYSVGRSTTKLTAIRGLASCRSNFACWLWCVWLWSMRTCVFRPLVRGHMSNVRLFFRILSIPGGCVRFSVEAPLVPVGDALSGERGQRVRRFSCFADGGRSSHRDCCLVPRSNPTSSSHELNVLAQSSDSRVTHQISFFQDVLKRAYDHSNVQAQGSAIQTKVPSLFEVQF